jgi:hypothetical protein
MAVSGFVVPRCDWMLHEVDCSPWPASPTRTGILKVRNRYALIGARDALPRTSGVVPGLVMTSSYYGPSIAVAALSSVLGIAEPAQLSGFSAPGIQCLSLAAPLNDTACEAEFA